MLLEDVLDVRDDDPDPYVLRAATINVDVSFSDPAPYVSLVQPLADVFADEATNILAANLV